MSLIFLGGWKEFVSKHTPAMIPWKNCTIPLALKLFATIAAV